MKVPVLPGESLLCSVLAGDVVLFGRKFLLPLFVGQKKF